MSFNQLLGAGGITLYILILCSILSLAIILERIIYYKMRSRIPRTKFMAAIAKEI